MWPFDLWRSRARRRERAITVGSAPSFAMGNTGDPWGTLVPGWAQVTPELAESIAAVGCAISSIASVLASLPAEVVAADDSRQVVKTHDLARLIRDGCNEAETWGDFLETLLSTTLLRGNATARIDVDQRGRLVGLTTLPWDEMTVRVRDDGSLLFDHLPRTPPNAGQRRIYERAALILLKDRSDSGLLGVPRLQRAAGAMQYAVQVQRAAQVFSRNAVRPGGVLSSATHMADDLRARLKAEWETAFRQDNDQGYGKVAVLSGGMTWTALNQLTAEDIQLIQARQWSVSDVARIFGVSPWVLGDAQRMTFASAKEAGRAHATMSLAPWAQRVQRAFSATVLAPQYRLQIDLGSLLKADVEALHSALLKARQAGVLSPNECRSELGWPAVPGGDSIEPPVAGGRPAGQEGRSQEPSAAITHLDQHRSRHGNVE